ncbi:MAG: metallophosphoesterase family protein [Geitlerinemataceae cyanobacterium]
MDDATDALLNPTSRRSSAPVAQRRLAVGDVHGHYDTLQRLLEFAGVADGDRIDFLGDLIDRGPDSRQTLELVRTTPNFHTIRGNHEEMAIAAFEQSPPDDRALENWLRSGGNTTLESYPDRDELYEHVLWLRECPLYRDLGDYWLVHAGLDPQRDVAAQSAREFCWIRDPFHRTPAPPFDDKLIIIGHTISFTFLGVQVGQLALGQGWLDIDTGAYTLESGWLTALDLGDRRVYQANVWTKRTRSLSWEEATIEIDPERVRPRRFIVK